MFIILEYNSLGTEEKNLLVKRKSSQNETVFQDVQEIIQRVRTDGMAALEAYSIKFDKVEIKNFIVPKEAIDEGAKKLEPRIKKAFL